MIYAIIANSKKLDQQAVCLYLKKYYMERFPLILEEKIFKKVSSELYLVRVTPGYSPGDILGYISQRLPLTNRDILYCIPIDEELMDRISEKTKDSFGYINDKSLEKLSSTDYFHQQLEYGITSGICFLAHYLQLIESDPQEISRKPKMGDYVLTDRFSQWRTEDVREIEKCYGSPHGKKKTVIKHERLVYSRFSYSDLTDKSSEYFNQIPLFKAAEFLGFKIMFRVDGEIHQQVNERVFNNLNTLVEIIFIGEKNWKERLGFQPNLVFYNKAWNNKECWAIKRKPEYWSLN